MVDHGQPLAGFVGPVRAEETPLVMPIEADPQSRPRNAAVTHREPSALTDRGCNVQSQCEMIVFVDERDGTPVHRDGLHNHPCPLRHD